MPRTKQFDREEVLEKALELFWQKGFNATSMQDLVDALGINRASIYDTFGNKHQLFVEVVEKYKEDSGAILKANCQSGKASVKCALESILNHSITSSLEDNEHKGCFMVNCAVELGNCDETIGKIVSENLENASEMFAQLIQQGQETGEISKTHNAKALGRFFFSTMNGIQVLAKNQPDKEILQDVKKVALSVLD